jgi:hypothetical protein
MKWKRNFRNHHEHTCLRTVLSSGMWCSVAWKKFTEILEDNIAPISRAQKQDKQLARNTVLIVCFLDAAWMVCFLTLKLEAVFFSETLLNVYQTKWCHILENTIPHSHCCKSLKSSASVTSAWIKNQHEIPHIIMNAGIFTTLNDRE